MATKPSSVPGWSPDPADIVEPSGGEKTAGFAVADKPPAQWFNWFWELVSGWVAYLRDGVIVGEAAAHGLTVTGGSGNQRGVSATGTGSGTGVVGSGGTTSGIGSSGVGGAPNGIGGRFFGTGNGKGVDARSSGTAAALFADAQGSGYGVEAQSSTGGGVKGTAGGTGTGVEGAGGPSGGLGVKGTGTGTHHGVLGVGGSDVASNGVRGEASVNGGAGVVGEAFDSTGYGVFGASGMGGGGAPGLGTDGTLKFVGTNQANSFGQQNVFHGMLSPKAWGLITMDGAGGYTVLSGANISAVAFPGSQVIRITFTVAFDGLWATPFGHGVLEATKNSSMQFTNWSWHDNGAGDCDYFEFKLRSEGGIAADSVFDPASGAPGATFSILFFGAQ